MSNFNKRIYLLIGDVEKMCLSLDLNIDSISAKTMLAGNRVKAAGVKCESAYAP